MTKNIDHLVELYDPDLSEFEPTVEMYIRFVRDLRMWKEGDQYLLWCDQCQQWHPIDKQTRQYVIDSHICPWCFRKADNMRHSCNIDTHLLIMLEDTYGYWVNWQLHNGVLKIKSAYQVAYWSETTEYVRNIIGTMSGGIAWWEKSHWRRSRTNWGSGYWRYHNDFIHEAYWNDPDDPWEYAVSSKREYYELVANTIELKSDQKKFITKGLYEENQLEFIRAFDLHDAQTVHKYTKYMKKHYCRPEYGGWNVHTLDYLYRNNIPLHDYYDYCNMCRILGRKPDKPTDFWHWHNQVQEAVQIKKNKAVSLLIAKRSEELPSYEQKQTHIKPIASYEELMDVSKTLHNCIRTYAERYADGRTDLFCMTIGDKIVGALEIRKKELIQARADHNGVLPPAAMKAVHQFCTQIGATWR